MENIEYKDPMGITYCKNCNHAVKLHKGKWFHDHEYIKNTPDINEKITHGHKLNTMCYETVTIEDWSLYYECNCKTPEPIT